MPVSRKSLTTVVAEAVIVIGMLAIVGHIAANVWDRVCIQSELREMKTNLKSLKNAVTNIGQAYDTLYMELQGIETETETKPSLRRNLQTHIEKATNSHKDGCTFYDKPKKNARDLFQECKPIARNTSWSDFLQKSAGVSKDFFEDPRLETICGCVQECFDFKDDEIDKAKIKKQKVTIK